MHPRFGLTFLFVNAPFAGTNYAFDWRLITHPKDYSGEMEGKHSRTLKLSKVPSEASFSLSRFCYE